MDKGTRGELLDRLAGTIESVTASHPLRVAVDGPPAAGKTTLADERAPATRLGSPAALTSMPPSWPTLTEH